MAKKDIDDSSTYKMDAHDHQLYAQAERQLIQFKAPIFVHSNNLHERLYVAAFDGTGNDRKNPEMGAKTNVALIYEQIEQLRDKGSKTLRASKLPTATTA